MKEKESTQLMTINKETSFIVKIKYFASCFHAYLWSFHILEEKLLVFLSSEKTDGKFGCV